MFKTKEVDMISVDYILTVCNLNREALVELIYRYEDFICNMDIDEIPSFNHFLYEHSPDLLNKLKPSDEKILESICMMIDYVDDILDSHDITVPDTLREDDEFDGINTQPSRLYGETYYDIEEYYKDVVYELLGQSEDEIDEDE